MSSTPGISNEADNVSPAKSLASCFLHAVARSSGVNSPRFSDHLTRSAGRGRIMSQHFALDDLSAGGSARLLLLGRKKHGSHDLLEPLELLGGFMGGMKKVALFTGMGAAITAIVGNGPLGHGG